MSLKDTCLRVALSKARSQKASADHETAREKAEWALLQAVLESGVDRVTVTLPDGTKVATVTVLKGRTEVTVDEKALLKWVEEVTPSEVEEVADTAVLADPEVLAWLRHHRPGSVQRRVRAAWHAAKVKEATANKGRILNRLTGEETQIAQVTQHRPTGAFQFKATDDGLDAVLAAYESGLIFPSDTSQDGD